MFSGCCATWSAIPRSPRLCARTTPRRMPRVDWARIQDQARLKNCWSRRGCAAICHGSLRIGSMPTRDCRTSRSTTSFSRRRRRRRARRARPIPVRGLRPTAWIVTVDLANSGYAAAEVPVTVRNPDTSVTQRVLVPARGKATQAHSHPGTADRGPGQRRHRSGDRGQRAHPAPHGSERRFDVGLSGRCAAVGQHQRG